ncbi:MAG: DUF115 domain-containing protein, partial [Nitrospira sp.]|nr:DUF115 domain-containing protein [Nitrospira sp.]
MRLTVVSKPATDMERRKQNIAASKPYPRFVPQENIGGPVAICAAGPSLITSLPIIRAYAEAGIPICAIKGVASVLLDHGIIPKYAVFLDSRPDQIRLLGTTHPDTIYCMGSTVDPALFEKLSAEGRDIRVWNGAELQLFTEPNTDYILGGSTTGLKAINLMRWAGYTVPHLFGYDCCLDEAGTSHVYDKANLSRALKVTIAGGDFTVTPEFVCQHQEFIEQYVAVEEPLNITVHGNGAIA